MRKFAILGAAAVLSAALAFGQAKQPQPKSQKEQEAIMAIFNAQDPDGRIAAVENLTRNFADTEFKAIAYQLAADAAAQKNDYEKTIFYGEKTLESDPKNYPSMILIARALAQRTREFDLDKEDKLNRADKLAKDGIELAQAAPKPRPDITDDQWNAAKKDMIAQAHEVLGMSANTRKKYDVAITEYKAALDSGAQADPATQVRLAGVYNNAGKPEDALALLDKLDATPNLHPAIKQVSTAERARATQAKGGAAKPAAAPATATSTPTSTGAVTPSASPAPTPSATPTTTK